MIEQDLFLNILILSWFIQTKTTIKVALSRSPPQGEKQAAHGIFHTNYRELTANCHK